MEVCLKFESDKYRKKWHKQLPFAILNKNTIYHSSIDCAQNRVCQCRLSHNIVDHKLGLRFKANLAPIRHFADEPLRRTGNMYDKTKKDVMQSYNENKKDCDKKAKTSHLKKTTPVSNFNQKQTTKGQRNFCVTLDGLDHM